MAIEPTRRTASLSASRPWSESIRRDWSRKQRGDRLEVVLHPVVDLPDGGVLGDQLAFAAAQFGHVAQQYERTDPRALGLERDGAQLDHAVVALDLELPGRPAAGELDQRLVHRAAGRGEFGGGPAEVVAHQVGGEAETVVGGERVGAGVLDDAVRVEPDQAVADPRRGVHVDLLAGERETIRQRSSGRGRRRSGGR